MAYVQTALTSQQLSDKRASSFEARQYVSVSHNPGVFQARINQTIFNNPLAQLTYDNETGDYLDIEAGMTVFIGATADIKQASFVGRIRKPANSAIIFINDVLCIFY